MSSRFCRLFVLALALVLFALPVAADRASAKELFRSGRSAYERGDFIAAAHAFEQAFEQDPTAESLYNAGLSWHGAERNARAANRYRRSLDIGGLDPTLAREAERLLAEIRPKLGEFAVEARDGNVTIAEVGTATVPAKIFVEPGTHAVRLRRSDGSESVESASVKAGESVRVVFRQPVATTSTPAHKPEKTPQPRVETGGGNTRQVLGFAAIGVSVAASATAVYLGTRAIAARDQWVDSELSDLEAHDRAVKLRTWTNVAWAGAAVFGATGIVLLLTGKDESKVGVSVEPHGGTAHYRARF